MSDELTDPEAKALGERFALACPEFRTVPGVLCWVDDDPPRCGGDGNWRRMRVVPETEIDSIARGPRHDEDWWPDLRDDATKGAALGVLRRRWRRPQLCIRSVDDDGDEGFYVEKPEVYEETEAECIVAALEAAPPEVSHG